MSSQQSSSTRKRPAEEDLAENRGAPAFFPQETPRPWVNSDFLNLDGLFSSDDTMPADDGNFSFNDGYVYNGESSTAFNYFTFDDVDHMEPEEPYLGISTLPPSDPEPAIAAENNNSIVPLMPNAMQDASTHAGVPAPATIDGSVPVPEAVPDPTVGLDRETSTGPNEAEWEKREELLRLAYAILGLTLPEVMKLMETAGFLKGATEKMYKTRFKKWNIVKNEKPKGRRPAKSNDAVVAADNYHRQRIFEAVELICESNFEATHGTKWAMDDQYRTLEDEWDDAFGEVIYFINQVAKSVQTSSDPPKVETIRGDLRPVVEALGFFSLPTILALIFRMHDKMRDIEIVGQPVSDLILECQNLSETAGTPRHKPLTKILKHVHSSYQEDPEGLQSLIKSTISNYIGLVSIYNQMESTTVLSLISFYLVYVNHNEWCLNETFTKIERLLGRSEKENGRNSDATLAILRLAIFILQRIDVNGRLWSYCNNMKDRIDERRKDSPGGVMEGKLLEDFLDVTHTLVDLNKGLETEAGDREAMRLMEEYKSAEQASKAKNDGYDKILEDKMEELKIKMEASSIS